MPDYDPTERLYQEHVQILAAIDQFREQLEQKGDQNELMQKIIPEILRFFRQYADQYHHAKEESELFPMLTDCENWVAADITQEMIDQHELFRGYTRDVEAAYEKSDYAGCVKILLRYTDQLKDHIAVEDNELFPMVLDIFAEDELEKLFFKFDDVDRAFGQDQVDTLLQIPDKLGD